MSAGSTFCARPFECMSNSARVYEQFRAVFRTDIRHTIAGSIHRYSWIFWAFMWGGGLIHLPLVLAVVVLVFSLLSGRRTA